MQNNRTWLGPVHTYPDSFESFFPDSKLSSFTRRADPKTAGFAAEFAGCVWTDSRGQVLNRKASLSQRVLKVLLYFCQLSFYICHDPLSNNQCTTFCVRGRHEKTMENKKIRRQFFVPHLSVYKVKPWSQGSLIAAGAYPGFCSIKRLEVFLLPLDRMLVHRRSLPRNLVRFPQQIAGTHLYTWVERGTVRVKCLAQEHNTLSPARARTRTARSGVERTNHEATAYQCMLWPKFKENHSFIKRQGILSKKECEFSPSKYF